MRFRAATRADAAAIRSVVFSVLAEYGLASDPSGLDSDLDDVDANFWQRGGLFEIIEDDDGCIVGTFALYALQDGVCELRKMYLSPDVRGKGWGKKIMDRLLLQARAMGFRRIELETARPLVEAIGLYRSYGFKPIDRGAISERCDQAFALDLDDTAVDPPASTQV